MSVRRERQRASAVSSPQHRSYSPRDGVPDLDHPLHFSAGPRPESVTTDVSRWFKRAQPPTSGVSPMRLREVALTCEVGGRSPRPRPPFGRCPVLAHVVTSDCGLQSRDFLRLRHCLALRGFSESAHKIKMSKQRAICPDAIGKNSALNHHCRFPAAAERKCEAWILDHLLRFSVGPRSERQVSNSLHRSRFTRRRANQADLGLYAANNRLISGSNPTGTVTTA